MCAHYLGLTDAELERLVDELTMQCQRSRARVGADDEFAGVGVEAYPKSVVPIIVPKFDTAVGVPELEPGSLETARAQWGFEQQWTPQPVFNTRIESADKPMWRAPMEHDRCVIACRWFYESHGSEMAVSARTGRKIKQQYVFRVPDEPVMLIGGVRRGSQFSMVTTQANADMEPIHPRMPLIVRQGELICGSGRITARSPIVRTFRSNRSRCAERACGRHGYARVVVGCESYFVKSVDLRADTGEVHV